MHRSRRIALSLAGVSAAAAVLVAATPAASARPGPFALAGKISLTSPRPSVTVLEHRQAAQPAHPRYVVVRPGDTLSVIARRVYGTSSDWPALWWANKTLIPDPNSVEVGEGVQVPASGTVSYSVMAQARAAAAPPPVVTTAAPAQPSSPVSSPPPAAPAPPESGGYGSPPAAFTACVIRTESGGDPTAVNPSSGASGLFGFLLSTWLNLGLGYPGGAYTAPSSVQYEGFDKLYAESGDAAWRPYDGCAA